MKTIECDIDYESPDGIDNCMTVIDYLHEALLNEFIELPGLMLLYPYLHVYSNEFSRNKWGHMDIFSAAQELFSPWEVIALYDYSSLLAQRTGCPIDRKIRIINSLEDSENLLEYKIIDVLVFQNKIRWMPPVLFQDFTNIIYYSGVMRYMCPEDNDKLKLFERKIQHAD